MPRGVVHAERDAFTVRRELEPCLIGRLPDSFEHLPGAADPRQLRRYLGDGPVRQDTLVGRRKTGACGIPGIGNVLRQDGGVAGGLQPVRIEGQGQQRTLAHEQEVALGKDGPGVRLNHRHFHVSDRAIRHTPSFRRTLRSRRTENDGHPAGTMGDGGPSPGASGPMS